MRRLTPQTRHQPRQARSAPRHRLLAVMLPLALMLPSVLLPMPAAADEIVGIDHVEVAADTVTVTGTAGAGETVDLYAIGAETSATVDGVEPLGSAESAADGSFIRTFDRTAGDGRDLLYAQFVAQVGGEQLGQGHFADSVLPTEESEGDYPTAASKKGLQVQLTDDAEELGVQHAGINLDLAAIMIKQPGSDADTIRYEYDGQEYYFDRSAVEGTDRNIKPLSDRGVLVNLIILLYQHPDDPNSAADILIHPDAVVEPGAGPVYGFNTVTEEGRRYLSAAMEFVASRWGSADGDHGRAVGYIVGNEVNAQWVWSNSGDLPLEEFVDCYARALRLMALAGQKFFQQSRTYVSMEHHWTIHPSENPDPDEPTRYYTGKALLTELNDQIRASGDFGWSVAYHPYPENLFEPDFWNDTTATDDLDTDRITFKNIQVLPEFLDDEAFRFQGQPRRIALTEQGCNTPGVGDALTEEAEKLQAACYAYAYYKIKFLPSIDSFILHRHVDHRGEGGLNLGLWAADFDHEFAAAPLRQKYSYDVFRYIDTERSLEVTEFAKEIIGIDEWADVIEGFDPAALDEQPIPENVGGRADVKLLGKQPLGRFDVGNDGWLAADNVSSTAVEDDALQVQTADDTFAKQWRGVVKDFNDPLQVDTKRWLGASLTVAEDADLGSETVARLKATLLDGSVVYGDARLAADGRPEQVAVHLPSDAVVTKIKIWVRGTGTEQPTPTFTVNSVDLARHTTRAKRPNVLITAGLDRAEIDQATMQVELTNLGDSRLRARMDFGGCGDFELKPRRTRASIPAGGSETVTAAIASATEEPSILCVQVNGTSFGVDVDIPQPTPNTLYGFESGTEGWEPGENVADVARVTSIPNGPGAPHGGGGALDAASVEDAPADAERTVTTEPQTPIDLSEANTFYAWLNSYGGAPGATGYAYAVTLTSADGSTLSSDGEMSNDKWNEVSVDVSNWAGRSEVTRIAISVHAVGSDSPWSAHFQVDDVGYFV